MINNMNNEKLDLHAPWVLYYRKLQCLFANDPEVKLRYYNDVPAVKIYAETLDKSDALTIILPPEMVFGNVTLKIEVIPPAFKEFSVGSIMKRAFKGNDILQNIYDVREPTGVNRTYVSFTARICQYTADDTSDLNGNQTMLAADIAKDIFGDQLKGVSIYTESISTYSGINWSDIKEEHHACGSCDKDCCDE